MIVNQLQKQSVIESSTLWERHVSTHDNNSYHVCNTSYMQSTACSLRVKSKTELGKSSNCLSPVYMTLDKLFNPLRSSFLNL